MWIKKPAYSYKAWLNETLSILTEYFLYISINIARPKTWFLAHYYWFMIFFFSLHYTHLWKVNIMNSAPVAVMTQCLQGLWLGGCLPKQYGILLLVIYISIVCRWWHSLCQSQALLQWSWDSAGCGALDLTQLCADHSRRKAYSESPT